MHHKNNERMNIVLKKVVGNTRTKSASPGPFNCQAKGISVSNNLLITCKLFNRKEDCSWALCKRTHKCKDCGSKNHGLVECSSKRRKKRWCEVGSIRLTVEQIKIVEVASLANRNILYQFICTYPCFFTSSRPNIFIKFRLADIFKLSLTNSPSPLKLTI